MRGIVISYRRGKHTQNNYQVIVQPENVFDKKEASKLVGKKVIWKSPTGKTFVGVITAPHGNKGKVRVRFRKGVPGQMLGKLVTIQ
ncbi:NEQ303 [Nanoarchaeum equitans Kin4-M]|uniref:Large ribosomal subunit protein eL33 n=1 Tax=Nanoarchaeum equitans (strain Kin4-M) TaxID=228908 RepID=Q74MU4_NANEQ|nr:NEQ303 [Nanoarchaeum equitans Kin4-M]